MIEKKWLDASFCEIHLRPKRGRSILSLIDKMVESQLYDKSDILNVSICELIERYIMRGLFNEDYYEPPKRTREELVEMTKKAIEKDKKRGFPPKKHNFAALIGILNKSD